MPEGCISLLAPEERASARSVSKNLHDDIGVSRICATLVLAREQDCDLVNAQIESGGVYSLCGFTGLGERVSCGVDSARSCVCFRKPRQVQRYFPSVIGVVRTDGAREQWCRCIRTAEFDQTSTKPPNRRPRLPRPSLLTGPLGRDSRTQITAGPGMILMASGLAVAHPRTHDHPILFSFTACEKGTGQGKPSMTGDRATMGMSSPQQGAVALSTADRHWLAIFGPGCCIARQVNEADAQAADAVVRSDPRDVYLWLWGRLPDQSVQISGDHDTLVSSGRCCGQRPNDAYDAIQYPHGTLT